MQAAAKTATAPPPAAPAQPKSRLANVAKGRIGGPPRVLIYGVEGVGKSSLAADAPAPIWFDIEDGTHELDVIRYPFRDGPGGAVPQSYQDLVDAITDLGRNEHPYKTLVLDTADKLESMIWAHIVKRDGSARRPLTNIEDYGYGKGYNVALDEWRALCVLLDRLRMVRGMSVVILAHAQIKTFKNPTDEDYDRYQLKLNDKASGFLKEWSDVVGFFCFEEGATKEDRRARAKGFSTGKRLLKFERTAAYDAKNRLAHMAGIAEVTIDKEHPWAPFLPPAIDNSDEKGSSK